MRAWKFGDNVNTDEIIPSRHNITTDENELAKDAFCEIRPEFSQEVQKGDVILAGENFGCGSSREHAPIAIKGSGVKCIIAKSFARIFFRNAINIGLTILECDTDDIDDGDNLEVDISTGKFNVKEKKYNAKPLPKFVMQIINAGGIIQYLQNHNIEDLK